MDFGLSEEQSLLETSVRGFLADRIPITRVRAMRDADTLSGTGIWADLQGLGIHAMLVGEDRGGTEQSLLDVAIVSQSLGYAATPGPYLSTAVMAPVALRELPEAGEWLDVIASGERHFGIACTELFSRREGAGVTLDGDRLTGKSMMALDCRDADLLLVALDASRLAVVERATSGLQTTPLSTVDVTRCTTELVFENVRPAAIYDGAERATARMLDAGRIALAADTLGACESMIERAVAYAAERKQFNRVIASFQAVKHMCAEMIAELEPARSLVWYAAHSFDAMPAETPLMACHALSHLSEIGRDIASTATQVHGGTGWTDEQNLHFWFKRIANARHLLGGPELLRARAAELQGFAA